jgi:hypothetical protein
MVGRGFIAAPAQGLRQIPVGVGGLPATEQIKFFTQAFQQPKIIIPGST